MLLPPICFAENFAIRFLPEKHGLQLKPMASVNAVGFRSMGS
jgi:hypothetical protein